MLVDDATKRNNFIKGINGFNYFLTVMREQLIGALAIIACELWPVACCDFPREISEPVLYRAQASAGKCCFQAAYRQSYADDDVPAGK